MSHLRRRAFYLSGRLEIGGSGGSRSPNGYSGRTFSSSASCLIMRHLGRTSAGHRKELLAVRLQLPPLPASTSRRTSTSNCRAAPVLVRHRSSSSSGSKSGETRTRDEAPASTTSPSPPRSADELRSAYAQQKLSDFRRSLREKEPDRRLILEDEVRRYYLLDPDRDLPESSVERIYEQNPYSVDVDDEADAEQVCYWLSDIAPLALKKHGREKLERNFELVENLLVVDGGGRSSEDGRSGAVGGLGVSAEGAEQDGAETASTAHGHQQVAEGAHHHGQQGEAGVAQHGHHDQRVEIPPSKNAPESRIFGFLAARKEFEKTLQGKRRWYHEGKQHKDKAMNPGAASLWQGLVSNSLILLIKFAVFLVSRSNAMYAEMMHSVADVTNYSYRLLMLSQASRRVANLQHPYGYAPLRYITADRSFVVLGIIGGVFPLLHGLMEFWELHSQLLVTVGDTATSSSSTSSIGVSYVSTAGAAGGGGVDFDGGGTSSADAVAEGTGIMQPPAGDSGTSGSGNAMNAPTTVQQVQVPHQPVIALASILPAVTVLGASMVLEFRAAQVSFAEIAQLARKSILVDQERGTSDNRTKEPPLRSSSRFRKTTQRVQTFLRNRIESSAVFGKASRCRLVYRYLQTGTDVMSIATFLEASVGVIGCGVGMEGLLMSYYTQSPLYDIQASVAMSTLVLGTSYFLLTRTTTSLLGQALPESTAADLVRRVVADFPTVADLYDIKSEILGTDTVRFKAEVRFNPEAVSGVKKPQATENLVNRLIRGEAERQHVEQLVIENDAAFYVALTRELKAVEASIKEELRKEFRTVHVDLEPM